MFSLRDVKGTIFSPLHFSSKNVICSEFNLSPDQGSSGNLTFSIPETSSGLVLTFEALEEDNSSKPLNIILDESDNDLILTLSLPFVSALLSPM